MERKKSRAAKKYFDLEADVGSDNERHDDRIKKKASEAGNSSDSSDDDNKDLSDDSFVDNEAPIGDDVEIEKAD